MLREKVHKISFKQFYWLYLFRRDFNLLETNISNIRIKPLGLQNFI
jgi:hypothetical protein